MKSAAIYLFITLLLGGCSTTSPSTSEYTLVASKTTLQNTLAPQSLKTLSVASSKPLSSLTGKSLIYLRENGESGPYLYSRWSDTPAILIQRTLIHSLQPAALFSSVIPASSLAQSDWTLESDLDGFHHRLSDHQSEGLIDITYRIVENKTKRVIATKRFLIISPAPSMDALGGVNALKNATDELNSQCIAWLHATIKEIK
jgi:cholesterol transport system auxiliary component